MLLRCVVLLALATTITAVCFCPTRRTAICDSRSDKRGCALRIKEEDIVFNEDRETSTVQNILQPTLPAVQIEAPLVPTTKSIAQTTTLASMTLPAPMPEYEGSGDQQSEPPELPEERMVVEASELPAEILSEIIAEDPPTDAPSLQQIPPTPEVSIPTEVVLQVQTKQDVLITSQSTAAPSTSTTTTTVAPTTTTKSTTATTKSPTTTAKTTASTQIARPQTTTKPKVAQYQNRTKPRPVKRPEQSNATDNSSIGEMRMPTRPPPLPSPEGYTKPTSSTFGRLRDDVHEILQTADELNENLKSAKIDLEYILGPLGGFLLIVLAAVLVYIKRRRDKAKAARAQRRFARHAHGLNNTPMQDMTNQNRRRPTAPPGSPQNPQANGTSQANGSQPSASQNGSLPSQPSTQSKQTSPAKLQSSSASQTLPTSQSQQTNSQSQTTLPSQSQPTQSIIQTNSQPTQTTIQPIQPQTSSQTDTTTQQSSQQRPASVQLPAPPANTTRQRPSSAPSATPLINLTSPKPTSKSPFRWFHRTPETARDLAAEIGNTVWNPHYSAPLNNARQPAQQSVTQVDEVQIIDNLRRAGLHSQANIRAKAPRSREAYADQIAELAADLNANLNALSATNSQTSPVAADTATLNASSPIPSTSTAPLPTITTAQISPIPSSSNSVPLTQYPTTSFNLSSKQSLPVPMQAALTSSVASANATMPIASQNVQINAAQSLHINLSAISTPNTSPVLHRFEGRFFGFNESDLEKDLLPIVSPDNSLVSQNGQSPLSNQSALSDQSHLSNESASTNQSVLDDSSTPIVAPSTIKKRPRTLSTTSNASNASNASAVSKKMDFGKLAAGQAKAVDGQKGKAKPMKNTTSNTKQTKKAEKPAWKN